MQMKMKNEQCEPEMEPASDDDDENWNQFVDSCSWGTLEQGVAIGQIAPRKKTAM